MSTRTFKAPPSTQPRRTGLAPLFSYLTAATPAMPAPISRRVADIAALDDLPRQRRPFVKGDRS
ncbi:hypothetical protein [Zoogloea sp. LCSB751]|uniref:hypothetical protein n=1 Tax=Zoogloea sp. LCSB751 TaxID=1965277 RepID=UPI0009A4B706|nr:hypothetical protein [Zoogloea sp. LCSB751]